MPIIYHLKFENLEFTLCFVSLVAEVRLLFDMVRKSRSAIARLHCALTELKSSLRNKKINCTSCAEFLVTEKIVALCFAALPGKHYSCLTFVLNCYCVHFKSKL